MDAAGNGGYTTQEIHDQLFQLEMYRLNQSLQLVDLGRAQSCQVPSDSYLASPESINRSLLQNASLDTDECYSIATNGFQGLVPPSGSLPAYLNNSAFRNHLSQRALQPARPEKPVCRFWPQGRCTYGQNCRFVHPEGMRGQQQPPSSVSLCRYYPSGRCHYGDSCRFKHEGAPPGRNSGMGLGPTNGNGMNGRGGHTGGVTRSNSARNMPGPLLSSSMAEDLIRASSLQSRLSLGASGSLPSPTALMSLDLLGPGYGGPRPDGSMDPDLEMARRNAIFAQLQNAQLQNALSNSDVLLGNGMARVPDDFGKYRFDGQAQLMRKSSNNLGQLDYARSNGLTGGNGGVNSGLSF